MRGTFLAAISLEMLRTLLTFIPLETMGTFLATISLEPPRTFSAIFSLETRGTFLAAISLETLRALLTFIPLETSEHIPGNHLPGTSQNIYHIGLLGNEMYSDIWLLSRLNDMFLRSDKILIQTYTCLKTKDRK